MGSLTTTGLNASSPINIWSSASATAATLLGFPLFEVPTNHRRRLAAGLLNDRELIAGDESVEGLAGALPWSSGLGHWGDGAAVGPTGLGRAGCAASRAARVFGSCWSSTRAPARVMGRRLAAMPAETVPACASCFGLTPAEVTGVSVLVAVGAAVDPDRLVGEEAADCW